VPSHDWPSIPQGDVSALSAGERSRRLAEFEARLRSWAAGTSGTVPAERPIISVETSAFKGAWLMPAIESVIGQTSGAWVYTMRWDGGDQLSRDILEIVERVGHPQLRVFFGENMGIAPSNRFLTANSIGDFIIQLDDDDMFAPVMVERFVATVIAKPWAGIVRARRDFIDEVGTHVPADPWFPFEPRHYQHGMIKDLHNHSQPALISRAAYDCTTGWDGFEEFLYAGADCDIFLKVEEVGPIVLLDELLYHYRLSGRRTSLKITDQAAYEMWRRLSDRTIARIGLPLERENEQPPFTYRRLPRPALTRDLIDFVVNPLRADKAGGEDDAPLQRTVQSLQRLGVPDDAIRVCARVENRAPACNEAIRAGTRPLVCLVRAGVEFTSPDQLDTLLAVMDEREADLAGPKVLTGSGSIHCADAGFDEGLPVLRGHAEPDHGQFDEVTDASWLASSALLMRREVDRGVGGFDGPSPDGLLAAADFCLKARQRDFRCVFVGTVAVHDSGPALDPGSEAQRQRFRQRWSEAPHLLQPLATVANPYNVLYDRGNQLVAAGQLGDALESFGQAITMAPERPEAYEGLGRAFSGLERWEQAAAAFERATVLDPSVFWPHYQLGDALRRVNRLDDAVNAYERAAAIQPDMAAAHAGLGHALFSQQRWEKAAAAHQRALALAPDGFWSHYQLGSALVRLGRGRDSVTSFQRAAALDHPEVFWACHSLGDVLQTMERWEDAAAAYQQAITLRHTVTSTHVQLAAVFIKLARWTDAAVQYETAVALDPSHADGYLSLAEVLSTLSRWEEAIVAYRRGVELKPDNAAGYAGLAKALYQTEQWEAAASAYRQAIELFPASSEWHHILGDTLLNLGRLDEAAGAFRRAAELNPSWSQRPLGPRVAAAERWLAGLLPAAETRTPGAGGALFVFDTDYGELTTAMYLLLGQELATRATFLLPSRLFVTNRDILPGRTRHYASVADVLSVVEAERPEIVFLCSAYVYSFHEILPLEELGRFVQMLGERGCIVVTTDPFLGLLSDLGRSTTVSVDVPDRATQEQRRLKEVLDERLNRHFSVSTGILEELPHLYPAYPVPGEHARAAAARGLSFFNPRLLHRPEEPEGGASDAVAEPIWLFVLASRDYEVQAMFHGKDPFVDLLARKIEQALQAGRHPVFIGPYDCVQVLIRHMADAGRWSVLKGVTLLTFCPFTRFAALLLSSEYAFYWNALSHSMFLRLFNERPVFLFDRGHLVRNVTPLYGRIVAWYYQGWDPIYLDPEQDLRAAPLGALADEYRQAAQNVVAGLRRSPSPAGMIEQLLREGRGVGVDD
jgi:tetratricopeptide (TPR) repeat protein